MDKSLMSRQSALGGAGRRRGPGSLILFGIVTAIWVVGLLILFKS